MESKLHKEINARKGRSDGLRDSRGGNSQRARSPGKVKEQSQWKLKDITCHRG